ncbi:MAG: hypothetical protein HY363_05380 [Candidatus Aenigmarchaeota archaeon]|nr:hypothetical protein [Candidatus Aenigmarchaeota archaeon]
MNKSSKIAIVSFIILTSTVFAICTDSDGGPTDVEKPKEYLAKPGTATVATSSSHDYCITKIDGAKTENSAYIREFYCSGGKAQSRDYKCADYSSGSCATAAGSSYCTEKPDETTQNLCGDKKIKKPEECDPPESICVQDGWPGLCTTSCTCMPYKKNNQTTTNQTTIQPETQTNTSTQQTNNTNLTIKEVLTPEEIKNATRHFEPVKPIAFNESIGIRAAYKIASFGHALWNWMTDIW